MKNKLTLLVAALILLQPLNVLALKPGDKAVFDKSTNIVLGPMGSYVSLALATLINGLTYNPVLFCFPGTECPPPPDNCCKTTRGAGELTTLWLQIMVPSYIVAMLLTALFFLIKAGTPRGRARARSMFLKLLFGMVVIALAPVIYQTLLDSSLLLTKMFLYEYKPSLNLLFLTVDIESNPFHSINDINDPDYHFNVIAHRLTNSPYLSLSCLIVPMTALLLIFAGAFIWLRNILVFFYGVFFPLILFFYFFEVTKPYGRKWLNQAVKWIYVPAFQALILVLTIQVANSVKLMALDESLIPSSINWHVLSNSLAGMMVLSGLAAFALAPLIVGQLMSWLGQSVIAVGLGAGRTWMVGLGGILAGHGPNALPYAHGEFTRQRSLERYMSAIRGVGGAARAASRRSSTKGAAGVGGGESPSVQSQAQIPEESGGEYAEGGGSSKAEGVATGPGGLSLTPLDRGYRFQVEKPRQQKQKHVEGGGASPEDFKAALRETGGGESKSYSVVREAGAPTTERVRERAPGATYDEKRVYIEAPAGEEGVREVPGDEERVRHFRRSAKPARDMEYRQWGREETVPVESAGGGAGIPLAGGQTRKASPRTPVDTPDRGREDSGAEEFKIKQMVAAEEQAMRRETEAEERARKMEADKRERDRRRSAEEEVESAKSQEEKKSNDDKARAERNSEGDAEAERKKQERESEK